MDDSFKKGCKWSSDDIEGRQRFRVTYRENDQLLVVNKEFSCINTFGIVSVEVYCIYFLISLSF